MSLSQSLPTAYTATPIGATPLPGGWSTLSDRLSRVFAAARRLVLTSTDISRLSAETLRDIGLVRGEPPYVGMWDHCRMDYRMYNRMDYRMYYRMDYR